MNNCGPHSGTNPSDPHKIEPLLPMQISQQQATLNYQTPFSRWHARDWNQCLPEQALPRLAQKVFLPVVNPKFRLAPESSFYTIGSCFARGLEATLVNRKFEVLSFASEFDGFETINASVTGRGFTNKYSSHSILNELLWALSPDHPFPEDSLMELDDGTWFDPNTNPTLKMADRETTLRRREIISNVTRRITRADVIVITLGLVEVWHDNHAGVYLNAAPLQTKTADPERYTLHVTDYPANFANMEAILALLKAHCRDFKMIVTTSPIPLLATYSGKDVVTANNYSKSTLVSVAQSVAAAHPEVDYFPSYEMVVMSDRADVWTPDGRHVKPILVKDIMNLFTGSYIAEG